MPGDLKTQNPFQSFKSIYSKNHNTLSLLLIFLLAQLFSTNAFSAKKICINALSIFTAIYSQSIVNTNNFFTYFYQRKPKSRKLHWVY